MKSLKDLKKLQLLPEAWQVPGYSRVTFGTTPNALITRLKGAEQTDTCPFCGSNHVHGKQEGHRIAHCAGTSTPAYGFKIAPGGKDYITAQDGTVLYQKSGYTVADYAEPDDAHVKLAGDILRDLGTHYPDTLIYALRQPVNNILSNLSFWLMNMNEVSCEAMIARGGTGFYIGVLLHLQDVGELDKMVFMFNTMKRINPLFKMRLPEAMNDELLAQWCYLTPNEVISNYNLPNIAPALIAN